MLSDLPNGESIAAMGWLEQINEFERELTCLTASGRIYACIDELVQHIKLLSTRSQHRAPPIPTENILGRLTKNGVAMMFDAPVRVLSGVDLSCPAPALNFEGIDGIFIVESNSGKPNICSVVGVDLVAADVIKDYRDGNE